jgi:hypothetical protein
MGRGSQAKNVQSRVKIDNNLFYFMPREKLLNRDFPRKTSFFSLNEWYKPKDVAEKSWRLVSCWLPQNND